MVLTHGLEVRPFSAALRAMRPAPTMTDGLEVLVQEVMEAIATMPWSRVYSPPFGEDTVTGVDWRPELPLAADSPSPWRDLFRPPVTSTREFSSPPSEVMRLAATVDSSATTSPEA